jgi:hypothetical protein
MSPPEPPYRVAYHQNARNQVQACVTALLAAGWDKEALGSVLEKLEDRLKTDPAECGETLFRVAQLDLLVAIVCARPFTLHIGIHEKSRTVFVRHVGLLTLSPP